MALRHIEGDKEVVSEYDFCECQSINQHNERVTYILRRKREACDKITHFKQLKEKYVQLTQELYDEIYNYYTNLRWSDIPDDEDFPDIPLPMSEYMKLKFIEDRIGYEMKQKEEQKQ